MMKIFFAACLISLPILTACADMTSSLAELEKGINTTKRPLENVELNYPNITFTFSATGKEHRSGDVFAPPKTIDCSRLKFETDGFKDAIKAGALVVRIQTPQQVKRIIKHEDGKETTELVNIKPVYGGVLALCDVSSRAKGPDARSYRIRELDDYLVKGKDGLISVVGAVLDQDNKQSDILGLGKMIESKIGVPISRQTNAASYSWMLWLTDQTSTFTDYEAEVAAKRKTSMPKPASPVPAATKTP